jgi:hypothetical protein
VTVQPRIVGRTHSLMFSIGAFRSVPLLRDAPTDLIPSRM